MCVSNYIICLYDVYIICMPSLLFLPNLNLYLPPFRIFLSRVPKIHLPHYVTYISFLPLYLHILDSLAILKLALSFNSFSCFLMFFLKYSGESYLFVIVSPIFFAYFVLLKYYIYFSFLYPRVFALIFFKLLLLIVSTHNHPLSELARFKFEYLFFNYTDHHILRLNVITFP